MTTQIVSDQPVTGNDETPDASPVNAVYNHPINLLMHTLFPDAEDDRPKTWIPFTQIAELILDAFAQDWLGLANAAQRTLGHCTWNPVQWFLPHEERDHDGIGQFDNTPKRAHTCCVEGIPAGSVGIYEHNYTADFAHNGDYCEPRPCVGAVYAYLGQDGPEVLRESDGMNLFPLGDVVAYGPDIIPVGE